jgi:hypothetical protein
VAADLLSSIRRQAVSCEQLGSPIAAAVLTWASDDYQAGGITRDLLDGVTDAPHTDAVALRMLAALHRQALGGTALNLARHYPSCGGRPTATLVTDVAAVVAEHRDTIRAALFEQVQTNEVARTCALLPALAQIAESTGLPLRTIEIGASAGLLSRMPWYHFDTGASTAGPADSPVRFDRSWFTTAPPLSSVHVIEQMASDLGPIDVTTDAGRLRARSFVWPEQHERMARLDAAIAVAREHPLTVEAADAADWLERVATTRSGTSTVVFHAIVWQYLPTAVQDRVTSLLHERGQRATSSATLHWLRFEPQTAQRAGVRLTSWPGGDDRLLATAGYHGRDVDWLG